MAKVSDNSLYLLSNFASEVARKLGSDINSILQDDSGTSPSGFLKKAYSNSSSKAVYYAPRNPNDGFPPRQNTLKDANSFSVKTEANIMNSGFKVFANVELDQGGRLLHKSLFGDTKGQSVYPWTWIDEGTTHGNRYTGNPRNINQAFTRDWHSQGYRGIFINKMGSQLRRRGWEVVR